MAQPEPSPTVDFALPDRFGRLAGVRLWQEVGAAEPARLRPRRRHVAAAHRAARRRPDGVPVRGCRPQRPPRDAARPGQPAARRGRVRRQVGARVPRLPTARLARPRARCRAREVRDPGRRALVAGRARRGRAGAAARRARRPGVRHPRRLHALPRRGDRGGRTAAGCAPRCSARATATRTIPRTPTTPSGCAPRSSRRCRAATVRIGVGVSLGALAMLHAHHTHPGTFDALFLQSGSFFTPRPGPAGVRVQRLRRGDRVRRRPRRRRADATRPSPPCSPAGRSRRTWPTTRR